MPRHVICQQQNGVLIQQLTAAGITPQILPGSNPSVPVNAATPTPGLGTGPVAAPGPAANNNTTHTALRRTIARLEAQVAAEEAKNVTLEVENAGLKADKRELVADLSTAMDNCSLLQEKCDQLVAGHENSSKAHETSKKLYDKLTDYHVDTSISKKVKVDNAKEPQFKLEILSYEPISKQFIGIAGSPVSATKNNNLVNLIRFCLTRIPKSTDGVVDQRVDVQMPTHEGYYLAVNAAQYATWLKMLVVSDRELKCRYYSFAKDDVEDAKVAIAHYSKGEE